MSKNKTTNEALDLSKIIYKQEVFIQNGMRVEKLTPIDENVSAIYLACFILQTPNGNINAQQRIDNALSLEEAFSKFMSAVEKGAASIKQQISKPNILIPNSNMRIKN